MDSSLQSTLDLVYVAIPPQKFFESFAIFASFSLFRQVGEGGRRGSARGG